MDHRAPDEGSPYNDSPYIGDIALQPPSPPNPAYEIPSYDYNLPSLPPSATFSPGSYNNSPYSNHSELSFGEEDPPLSLFDDQLTDQRGDYNPTEYDSNSFGLLMFNDSEYMHSYDQQSHLGPVPHSADYHRHSFDHGSPSSTGGESGGENPDLGSRRSSMSSHQFSPSPRLDVAQSFENMSFSSPHWGSEPLPREGRTPDQLAQQPQATSPPRLMMPEGIQPSSSAPNFATPPMINAPDGDGADASGPSVRIVPATPVSGGGSASTGVAFQATLQTLNQGQPQAQNWNLRPSSGSDALGVPYTNYSHSEADPTQGAVEGSPTPSFLFRGRSKSDTSREPPKWDTVGQFNGSDSALDEGTGLDLLHPSSSPSTHHTPFSQPGTLLNQGYVFGQPSSALHTLGSSGTTPSFLSPDMGALRRSKSDARPNHRQSRSDDLRPHVLGFGQEGIVPGQFLSPQDQPPAVGRGMGGATHGHFRRASSGSRSERGVSAGAFSGPSSGRGSPYPSPNVSPRGRFGDLPSEEYASMTAPPVARMNVTTGRTANASLRRRKQEATFVCPIPGCGSTFTRSFNLKGHIRSHNEEKPFQCHWPGCGKGFARQHDCKRHEQLHTNYRPFNCDGCKKPFARMDALNRHLRSEGGAECKRLLEDNGTLPNLGGGGEGSRGRKANTSKMASAAATTTLIHHSPSPGPKPEPELWPGVTL